MRCSIIRSSRAMAAALLMSLSASFVSAGSVVLYDADPDNNTGTPAPNPTSQGWKITNLDGFETAATFSNPGLNSDLSPAWILDDAGGTGRDPVGNQSNSLHFDLPPSAVDKMNADFVLTLELEQLSDGAFVGFGYNHDGVTDEIGLTGDTRYGQSPDAGPQVMVTTWDGTTLTTNPGAAGPSGFSPFWGGAVDGGMRVFFGDNTRGTAAFNLAITKVTLEGSNIPEPASLALACLGLVSLTGLRRRRQAAAHCLGNAEMPVR